MGKIADELNERSRFDDVMIVGSEIRAAIVELEAERDNYKEGLEVIVNQEDALSSVDYIDPATIARAHLTVLK